MELACGRTVYEVVHHKYFRNSWKLNDSDQFHRGVSGSNTERDGLTGIADIDLDGQLDVVVMAADANVYVWNPRTNTLIAQRSSGSTTQRGALFIGDIDGDGRPNIGYCRSNAVDMLSYNSTTTLQRKWTLTTTDDSGRTGITMFDFDQDGKQELVYRDETTLRIIDGSGATPVTVLSVPSFLLQEWKVQLLEISTMTERPKLL